MESLPFDLDAALTTHGAALQRLAAGLVHDRATADDVVQDVWLDTVRRPPPHGGAIGAWLRTALRHAVTRLRRTEARRRTREATVAVTIAAVPSPVVQLQHTELAQRLVGAVAALPTPYRQAIWLRYFEGRPPAAMAELLREPLPTIKSRLQRGLQMLRERLDRDEDRAWRPLLVATFGLPREGPVERAAAWRMCGRMAAAVALVGVAAWVAWSAGQGARPGRGAVALADRQVSAAAAEATGLIAAPVQRQPASPPVAAVVAATLRGRCVDPTGAPLAGCSVVLIGSAANQGRVADWQALNGGSLVWQDPAPITTAADGRFEFVFVPPPPYRFEVVATCAGRIGRIGTWETIEATAVVDTGDVVLRPGIAVRGRVVDEQGRPRAQAKVMLQAPFAGAKGWRDDATAQVTAGADGRFAVAKTLPPGFYLWSVAEAEVVRPAPWTVADSPREQQVEMVVREVGATEHIRGRVLDDLGEPVAHALLDCNESGVFELPTDAEGRFELRRRRGAGPPAVAVRVFPQLHEPLLDEVELAWGIQGVELRVRRGAPIEFRVVDATGQPIDNYLLRVVRHRETFSYSEWAQPVSRGPIQDGTTTIASVPDGAWLLLLELPPATGLQWWAMPFRVVARTPQRLEIRVVPGERVLQVVDSLGSPRIGTRVAWLDPLGLEIDDAWISLDPLRFVGATGPARVFGLGQAVTDANGEVRLRGPADRLLMARIEGAGHLRLVVRDVSLADPAPLRLTVATGERVAGQVAPLAAIAELRRLAGVAAEGEIPAPQRAGWAKIRVASGESVLDEQGRFELLAVPSGVSPVTVTVGGQWYAADPVTVPAGGGEVTVDLTFLLPGVLQAEVVHNGVPVGGQTVDVSWHGDSIPGVMRWARFQRTTDAHGRFELRGCPGEYSVLLPRPGFASPWLPAASPALIVRDQTTHHTFAIESGHLQLVLNDAAGQPFTGGKVYAISAEPPRGYELLRAEPTGAMVAELPPGTWELAVIERNEFRIHLEPVTTEWQRPRLRIGEVTIVRGQTTNIELRVPRR